MPVSDRARQLALAAAQAAADKKATDVLALDVSDQLIITDAFVIASAPNERQVGAIVDAVEDQLRTMDTKPVRREGAREGRWVLLDFADIIVHVQHDEERSFYALERLWKDCPVIPFVDSALADGTPNAGSVEGSESADGSAASAAEPVRRAESTDGGGVA